MFRFYLFISALFLGIIPKQTVAVEPHRIEIISSYAHNNEWNETLTKKLKKVLEESIPESKIHFTFHYQPNGNPISSSADLLIFIGQKAWQNYLQSGTTVQDTPKIVCDRTSSNDTTYAQYNAVKIPLNHNPEKIVGIMKQLMPSLQNILYFSEQSYSDEIIIGKLESWLEKNKPTIQLAVIKSSNINIPYLTNVISNLTGENTAVLLNHFNITAGNINAAQTLLSKNTPVFLLSENNTLINNDHVVGGFYISTDQYAHAIAKVAQTILNGTEVSVVSTADTLVAVSYMNNAAIAHFHLQKEALTQPAVFIGEIGENAKVSYGFILFILVILLAALLFLSFRTRRKKRALCKIGAQYTANIHNRQILSKSIPVGIAVFNKAGNLLERNPEADKIFRQIIPYYKNNTFNLFEAQIIKELSREKPLSTEIFYHGVFTKSNGDLHHCKITVTPIFYENSNILFMMIEDDTKAYFDELSKKKIYKIFNTAIDYINIGIGKFNLLTRHGSATESWYNTLEVGKQTPFNECFKNVHTDDGDMLKARLQEAVQSKTEFFTLDIRVGKAQKKHQWYNFSAWLKEYNPQAEKIIYYFMIRKIDNQKSHEIVLENEYQKLLRENQTNNSLIANMNHEIRTPLNAIIGFSELLIENYDAREQDELLQYINENNEKLLTTINDIISMSKIETGQMLCNIQDINLNEFIQSFVERTKQIVNPEKIKVIFNKGDNYILQSDEERLKQIINNFISNAVKFTETGFIEIGFTHRSDHVCLYVKDTGHGIPEDKRDLISNQLGNNKERHLTSGLGLPIAYYTAKLLKGEIGFESRLNEGSTFWCKIPNIDIRDGEIIKNKLENATLSHSGKKTILIAEDNQNNYQLLHFLLKQKYRIIHAINGEEAVNLFQQEHPDLILMDIKMPVMDGYQATAAIREISKEIPIIAVTAFAFDEDKEKVLKNAFNEYISKPVMEKELMRVIDLFIDKTA